MSSSKASIRKCKSTQGIISADAVELNGSSGDVDDDRPFQHRRPRPRPLSSLPLVLFSLLARLARFILAKLLPASLLPSWRRYRKWRSTRLRGRAFGAALPPDDDERQSQQRRRGGEERAPPLPTDVGLAALRLANCRDLASACDPLLVAPGRLFRSASPFAVAAVAAAAAGGGGGGAEEAAARALSGASARASGSSAAPSSSSSSRGLKANLALNLALVIDLRSVNEWEAGSGDEVLRALAALQNNKKSRSGNESAKRSSSSSDAPPLRVERVALQEWTRYTYAFVARLPATRSLGAAAHFLLLKGLGFKPPLPGMHARLCADAERGGLVAMNTTVLAASAREIARVLRLISGTLSSSSSSSPPSSAPSSPSSSVMVACKLGKDRTGLVSALCLAVAGASRREVVADYARSAVELAGRPPPATAPSLGGAPRAAMERTLDWLSEHFGAFADEGEVERYRGREERRRGRAGGAENENGSSRPRPPCWRAGVLGYLEREARFRADEREALRRALTE